MEIDYENIKSIRNNELKLKKLQKDLSRKQKGSKNKDKAFEKIDNKKEYYLHQITNQLLSKNQTIVNEDLSVSEMMKNKYLVKSIQELSLNRFKTILEYKAKWYNREIITVDK